MTFRSTTIDTYYRPVEVRGNSDRWAVALCSSFGNRDELCIVGPTLHVDINGVHLDAAVAALAQSENYRHLFKPEALEGLDAHYRFVSASFDQTSRRLGEFAHARSNRAA